MAEPFTFVSFPPRETAQRADWWKTTLARSETVVFMDTPYRFLKTVEELAQNFTAAGGGKSGRGAHSSAREVFFAVELNAPREVLFRGGAEMALEWARGLPSGRVEFVGVVGRY